MRHLLLIGCVLFAAACGVDSAYVFIDAEGLGEEEPLDSTEQAVSCPPTMSVFPVRAAHNIGYDRASCGTGTCRTSCPDANANSDWNGPGGHHGIDIFAYQRAPLVAVADGTVMAVGTPSGTSGLRVRVADRCGWHYYYGHLDQAVVSAGQRVTAGQLLGYMGRTGTQATHLHFNVSPDGRYSADINPFELLKRTSPTACQAAPTPTPPPAPTPAPTPAPSPSCGRLVAGQALGQGQSVASCDGRFRLVMQGDGNLVLYQGGVALWHTFTNGKGGATAVMQADGNFVLYTAGGTALWHTWTFNRPGAFLAVQNDGNLVLYSGSTALWNSRTCCR